MYHTKQDTQNSRAPRQLQLLLGLTRNSHASRGQGPGISRPGCCPAHPMVRVAPPPQQDNSPPWIPGWAPCWAVSCNQRRIRTELPQPRLPTSPQSNLLSQLSSIRPNPEQLGVQEAGGKGGHRGPQQEEGDRARQPESHSGHILSPALNSQALLSTWMSGWPKPSLAWRLGLSPPHLRCRQATVAEARTPCHAWAAPFITFSSTQPYFSNLLKEKSMCLFMKKACPAERTAQPSECPGRR